MVELTVKVPENIARKLGETTEAAARELLEDAAAEGYRSGRFSRRQVREMLHLSWYETEEFLARHDCPLGYTVRDLEKDRETLNKVLGPVK
jgi:predicted HTH domain antitoxin